MTRDEIKAELGHLRQQIEARSGYYSREAAAVALKATLRLAELVEELLELPEPRPTDPVQIGGPFEVRDML